MLVEWRGGGVGGDGEVGLGDGIEAWGLRHEGVGCSFDTSW